MALVVGLERVEIAAWVDQDRRVPGEQAGRAVTSRRDGTDAAEVASGERHPKHHVVRQPIGSALDPEVAPEGDHEREHVGRHDPTVVGADHQRFSVGDVLEAEDVRIEPGVDQRPQDRELAADEFRIALIERVEARRQEQLGVALQPIDHGFGIFMT